MGIEFQWCPVKLNVQNILEVPSQIECSEYFSQTDMYAGLIDAKSRSLVGK